MALRILNAHIVIIGCTLEHCKNQGWKSLTVYMLRAGTQSCKQIFKTPEPREEIVCLSNLHLVPSPSLLLLRPTLLHCELAGPLASLVSFTNTFLGRSKERNESQALACDQLGPGSGIPPCLI